MNAPTSAPVADDKPLPVKSASEEFPAQIESDTERTKSSLARLTSNSVDRLERLMAEIQEILDSGAKCNRAKQTGFARLCQAL